jgi:hypothetical protein
VVDVVMHALRDGEPLRHLYRYGHLVPPGGKEGLAGIVQTLVLNPFHVSYQALDAARLVSLLKLLLPVAMLPLAAFSTVLFVAAPLASNLLSNWDIQHTLQLHYSIAILGPLYVAALCGARNWLHPERATAPYFVEAGDTGPAALEKGNQQGARKLRSNSWLRDQRTVRATALVAFVVPAVLLLGREYGRFPGGGRFDREDYERTDHHRRAATYMARLPSGAAVSAHSAVGAHLTRRERIYVFPEIQDARWILVDTKDHPWPMVSRQAYERRVRALLTDGRWGLERPYEDGFLLLRKGGGTPATTATLSQLDFAPYR